MSTILVLTPLIISSWPMISAAVVAAVGTMGFTTVQTVAHGGVGVANNAKTETAEIDVEDSEILASSVGADEEIVVEKEGLRAVFSRDARGALRVCVEGKGHSKAELRRIGQELIDRVTQQYVYHRIVSELKDRHMTIVDEEVKEDRTVKIRIRNS
jgi:hypothetical protein